LRPVAARALEAGRTPRRFAPGIMGRTLTVWLLGSGVPVVGILIAAAFQLFQPDLSRTQFAIA
jgi:adenylate cyclase